MAVTRSTTLFITFFLVLGLQVATASELERARDYLQSTSIVFSDIIEKSKPAVVYIEVEKRQNPGSSFNQ
ncbi:hypothetical protein [Desulfopila sp. IMCC35008]|uniref:hypothetical protein n=1 Tax=Desulfopila sp. IMCC35008 TaxID=2653858 RepID=UPI0013D65796|nr:hypothetical protein [Desulfopila sp. IMCC35008]